MRSSPAPSICAILAAAGVGSRLAGVAGSGPKQFLALGGRPIYQWSLCELAGHEQVGLVVVATLSDSISTIQAQIEGLGLTGRTIIIAGGSTRQQSVWLGLKELSRRQPPPGYVLVHDAARPFLTREILDATITVVKEKGACTTCVPASDTVKRVQNGQIVETLDRNSLVLVQTPQAARYDWLVDAHEKAIRDQRATTDDAALLESAGYPVAAVSGSRLNIKITEPHDLVLAEVIAATLRHP